MSLGSALDRQARIFDDNWNALTFRAFALRGRIDTTSARRECAWRLRRELSAWVHRDNTTRKLVLFPNIKPKTKTGKFIFLPFATDACTGDIANAAHASCRVGTWISWCWRRANDAIACRWERSGSLLKIL